MINIQKVFQVGGGTSSIKWLINQSNGLIEETCNIEDANIIVFTGGGDISPDRYGQRSGKYTRPDFKRDESEFRVAHRYMETSNVLKIGICRGAQLLAVTMGFKLIQNVNNHYTSHKIYLSEIDKFMTVNSLHHQMINVSQYSSHRQNIILGHSVQNISTEYLDGNNEEINLPNDFIEPELIYFPDNFSLCIQCHPEMMNDDDPFLKYLYNYIMGECLAVKGLLTSNRKVSYYLKDGFQNVRYGKYSDINTYLNENIYKDEYFDSRGVEFPVLAM